ncbi:DUF6518 family protein [uncultured Jatrophihabitans sp.]|uniref:DUF6518 family protein n=1 Tax=uncultured Jatrophihabitans sp. TaxID=1610747 RepID=UPI0035CC3520
MNQTPMRAHPPQAAADPPGRWSYPTARVLMTAIAAGLLLGPLDLLAQTTLPYPWANLANSGAVWALAAFILGATVRPATASAVAGLVLLPIAVESYYLAGVIFRHDSTATLWDGVAVLWLVLAVIVGPLFGRAGGAVRSRRAAIRFAAAAFAGAIFLLEALVQLGRSHTDGGSNHAGQTAVIEMALAVMVPLVTVALTRTRR